MRYTRLTIFSIAGVLLLLAAILIVNRSTNREEARMQTRYQQMLAALSANDTNSALLLVAPMHRSRFRGFGPSAFKAAAQPLGFRSHIYVSGDEATICPNRPSPFLFLPGGDTIEMIKVDGDWFFTGDVDID